jgi:hypothetical protein
MDYVVPALLFPAIPLMMINFGNRYALIASLIRRLHDEYLLGERHEGRERYIGQIRALRQRLRLIGIIQTASGAAFLLNLGVMLAIYKGAQQLAFILFGIVLVLMMLSMLLFIVEVQVANRALDLHLSDLEEFGSKRRSRRSPEDGNPS